MWKRSFVATTVALGGGVDDALAALAGSGGRAPDLDAGALELVERLRAPRRATRAAGLATAVRDVVVALDEGTLR
ncbi:MAG: hypothetical protein KIS78_30315 [Labilithrix sp.]|nr:hypothetical protein [Labilithrix sp.]MCW5836730.1 hypothetical protein [Labilithrix sp.]